MATQNPQTLNATKLPPSSQRGEVFHSTTYRLMNDMTRDFHKLPDNIVKDKSLFAALTIRDVEGTHTKNEIKDESKNLQGLLTDIQANLDRWKSAANPSGRRGSTGTEFVSATHQSAANEASLLSNDVEDRTTKRKELEQESQKLIEYKDGLTQQIIQAIADNKPASEIEAMLADIKRRQKDLDSKKDDLNKLDSATEQNLKTLLKKTDDTVRSLVSSGVLAPQEAPRNI